MKEQTLFESTYIFPNRVWSFYFRSTSEVRMSEAGNRQEIICLRQVTTRESETSLKTYTFVQTVFVFFISGPRPNSGEMDLLFVSSQFMISSSHLSTVL